MADKSNRYPDNVPGMFYVDKECIDCNACNQTAPDYFSSPEGGGYSFVKKQPSSEDEIAVCMEALEGCPVEAIGCDGDS